MKRIRVSRIADQDLDGIWNYIAISSGSMETATDLIESISSCFPLLAESPKLGTLRPEIGPGVRSLVIGSYIVYYREQEGRIAIARILHGMRDQRSAFLDRL